MEAEIVEILCAAPIRLGEGATGRAAMSACAGADTGFLKGGIRDAWAVSTYLRLG